MPRAILVAAIHATCQRLLTRISQLEGDFDKFQDRRCEFLSKVGSFRANLALVQTCPLPR